MEQDMKIRLGEKVKALRRNAGLTQNKLSGQVITRNMLSLIESGRAVPSVDTLEYLADRLGVGIGYFFASDEAEEAQYRKISTVTAARQLYKAEEWSKVSVLCRHSEVSDDELSYITATAELMLALECMNAGMLASAREHLKLLEDAAVHTCYDGERLRRIAKFYEHLTAHVSDALLPDDFCDIDMYPDDAGARKYFAFFTALSVIDKAEMPISTELLKLVGDKHMRAYLEARMLYRQENYAKSRDILERLLSDGGADFVTHYRALCDLEACCGNLEDFRGAYESARMRLAVIEQYSK